MLTHVFSRQANAFVGRGIAVSKVRHTVSLNGTARWCEKQRGWVLIRGWRHNGLKVVLRSACVGVVADLRILYLGSMSSLTGVDRGGGRLLWGNLILS